MILSCNSCGKKFVVPDQAITADGRLVQCGSCGNKWKQFPEKSKTKEIKVDKKISTPKKVAVTKISKTTKKRPKKTREINLYSPEYLRKKHGISLDTVEKVNTQTSNKKSSIGFYYSLIIFIIILIAFSRILYFTQDFIVQSLPFTEFYLEYFFETIRNMFDIYKNLFSSY